MGSDTSDDEKLRCTSQLSSLNRKPDETLLRGDCPPIPGGGYSGLLRGEDVPAAHILAHDGARWSARQPPVESNRLSHVSNSVLADFANDNNTSYVSKGKNVVSGVMLLQHVFQLT